LARNFRVYLKKRGSRRTGSPALGIIGEAVFFSLLFLAGCVGLVCVFAWFIIPEWRANHEFIRHACRVLDKRVAEIPDGDSTTYRPEIQIEYEVGGETFHIWTYDICGTYSSGRVDKEAVLENFQVGKVYPCWYDPANPSKAVLVRGYSWLLWLFLILPISFVLIGGGGLIHAVLHLGKSAERSAATTKGPLQLELFEREGRKKTELPKVPTGADMTNSPGTKLAYRLPIGTAPAWVLFSIAMASLILTIVWAVFMVVVIGGHLKGNVDWTASFFAFVLTTVVLGMFVLLIRQLLITAGIGPTNLEISDHPLYPGSTYRVFLSQSGKQTMKRLSVLLMCEEVARYRQGTDTRTEKRKVCEENVFEKENLEIGGSAPYETDCDVVIPHAAMHSFKSDHNEVNWSLVVFGDVDRRSNYKRTFPVIVHPKPTGN